MEKLRKALVATRPLLQSESGPSQGLTQVLAIANASRTR